METKICSVCKQAKPLDDFGIRSSRTPHLKNSRCRVCHATKTAEWRQFNKRASAAIEKKASLKFHYKVTWREYLELTKNGCYVCGTMDSLCIDHDHSCCLTNKKTCGECIRGVLCARHNKILGYARDSKEELLALVDYLTVTSRA